MEHLGSSTVETNLNEDPVMRIGSAASVEEIIGALARDGCSDLTPVIDFTACSDFPCAGGGFCNVYQGSLHNGARIALKSLRAYDRPEAEGNKAWRKNLKNIAKELHQWSRLQHSNVLPLMGLAVFRGHISMVSQWVENGDLMSYLRRNPDVDRIKLCVEICAGLHYIHTNDLIHGDLKATNILVSSDGTALIADFGNAEMENFTLKSTDTAKGCLSVRWAAPELFLANDGPHVSKEADVYAYGMTVLEALTGEVPYPGFSDIQVISLVTLEQNLHPRPNTRIDDRLWKILSWCWAQKPSERPGITTVKYCLHALFPPVPDASNVPNQAPAGGQLEGNSKGNVLNDGFKLWVHSVSQQVSDSVSELEKRRQEAINELIYTERDFVRGLEYLRNRWMEPLRTQDIVPPERRADFVQQLFSCIEGILDVNTRLLDLLIERQNTHPVVGTIGDIFLELVPHFRRFVQYGKRQRYGQYDFEQEISTNPAFEVFVETVERLPGNNELRPDEYLLLPTARLARYSLLLEAVLKYTPEDNADRVTIPEAVGMIGEFLGVVNRELGRVDHKFKLLQLDEGSVFRRGEETDPKPDDEQDQLIHSGLLELRGRTADENSKLELFLFDDTLMLIQSNMVNGHEQREIFRRPIPLELLFVSTPERKAARAPKPRTQPAQRNSNGLTANVSAPTPDGSVAYGLAAAGTFPPAASARPNRPDPQKTGYRLTVSRLGRNGYSLTLWAPTRTERRQWVEDITAQQSLLQEQNKTFDSFTQTEDRFIREAKVNCAVSYDHDRRIAYGTDAGVYFQSLHDGQNQAPFKALDLVEVQQIDVLEEFQLLIVLSGRSVIAFPLDAPDTADLMKGMKRISSYTSFLKVGHCLGRALVCVVKTSPQSSTIKMLEPIGWNTLGEDKPTLKAFREFYLPTESNSVYFLETKLCLVSTKGFEIIDLETLDTHILLDPAGVSLNFVQQHENARPLCIYRIGEEYLLCYTDFAFYVNEGGSRSRKGVNIYWEGTPTAFALHYPYIMAFDPTFIEIRNLDDDGSLVQAIRGTNLRLLFANTQVSTTNTSSLMGSSNAPQFSGGHSSPHAANPSRQSQSNESDAVVPEPKGELPAPEGAEILIVSDDKVIAVRPVTRRIHPESVTRPST